MEWTGEVEGRGGTVCKGDIRGGNCKQRLQDIATSKHTSQIQKIFLVIGSDNFVFLFILILNVLKVSILKEF